MYKRLAHKVALKLKPLILRQDIKKCLLETWKEFLGLIVFAKPLRTRC
ncbi:MAG: hypothetical protein RMY35_031665 [Nostoc sp. DedSLP01]